MKYFLLLAIFLINNACLFNRFKFAPNKELKKPLAIEFCELPQYDSAKLVKVRAIFSGVEEYWSLCSPNSKQCPINGKVDFSYDDEESVKNAINAHFLGKRLRKLHNNYSKYEVELDITGQFQTDTINGFGHLGTNKYNLNAKKVKVVKYLRKKSFSTKSGLK